MQQPIISIIMPCYNGADYLKHSIASVYAQTFKNFELIVVNDGSSDDSPTLLTELARAHSTLHVIHQSNRGEGAARNSGLKLARGEFIAFLDADDSWHPDFLSSLYQALQEKPNAMIAYCGWQNTGLSPNRCKPHIPPDYETFDKAETFLRSCPWPVHGVLTRRSTIMNVDGFNESWAFCVDYDLWLRIAPFHEMVLVPIVLAYYHHHAGEQLSKNHLRMALSRWNIQQAFLEKNPSIAKQLGTKKIADLVDGGLLHRAYASFWQNDLTTSHSLFRKLLFKGYFKLKDLKYLLPALLPFNIYQSLILKYRK